MAEWRKSLGELKVLWLTLALLGLAEAALHGHVFRSRQSSLANLRAWSAEPVTVPAADVLLVGSSRFRPLGATLIGAAARPDGTPLRVVNA